MPCFVTPGSSCPWLGGNPTAGPWSGSPGHKSHFLGVNAPADGTAQGVLRMPSILLPPHSACRRVRPRCPGAWDKAPCVGISRCQLIAPVGPRPPSPAGCQQVSFLGLGTARPWWCPSRAATGTALQPPSHVSSAPSSSASKAHGNAADLPLKPEWSPCLMVAG